MMSKQILNYVVTEFGSFTVNRNNHGKQMDE